MTVNLDLSVLRTLIAIVRTGSFARAAERVGRSESAVSLQLKRLEEQVGQKIFHRAGRNMVLTEVGESMLAYAEDLIALNDKAVGAAAAQRAEEGIVRLGVPPDFAETWLPIALTRFMRVCPSVEVDTKIERSPNLLLLLDRGALDLAISFASGAPHRVRWSGLVPMAWIGPRNFSRRPEDAVRLAVLDPPCLFRNAATTALDSHGMSWTVDFKSASLASLWAAVAGGLGITVRTPHGLPPQLTVLGETAGLPSLPPVALTLFEGKAPPSTAAARLADVLTDTLAATLGGSI